MKEPNQKLIDLDPEVEAQLPEMVRTVRGFYRSLSPEDRAKLDGKVENATLDVSTITKSDKESKFCFECGKPINRLANFCEYCGAKQPVLFE